MRVADNLVWTACAGADPDSQVLVPAASGGRVRGVSEKASFFDD
jgi:hypothetical protein